MIKMRVYDVNKDHRTIYLRDEVKARMGLEISALLKVSEADLYLLDTDLEDAEAEFDPFTGTTYFKRPVTDLFKKLEPEEFTTDGILVTPSAR